MAACPLRLATGMAPSMAPSVEAHSANACDYVVCPVATPVVPRLVLVVAAPVSLLGVSGRWAVIAALLLFVAAAVRWAYRVVEESLLVTRGVGLRFRTRYASGRERVMSVKSAAIAELAITEALRIDRCYFQLECLLGADGPRCSESVVAFPTLLPRLSQLEQVYHGAHAILWGGNDGRDDSVSERSRHASVCAMCATYVPVCHALCGACGAVRTLPSVP